MKKILTIASYLAALTMVFSCETYKIKDPDMSAINKVDGKYMAFATAEGDSDPSTIFGIVITNTTNDDSDAGWITITDLNYAGLHWQRLFSVRFHIDIDADAQTFQAANVEVIEPRTAWNPYIEGAYGSYGSYYTATYQWGSMGTATASISDGKVVTDGVDTPSGYKADSIEFDYTLTYTDGTSETYSVKGQKKTGWADDASDYEQWLADKGWW